MWGAQGRYADLGDMVDGVREAGGERIEINYMPTREQLAQLLARPDLVVSSVHNICPRPTDATGGRIPDPSLVAADDDERRAAVALTRATMDLARRVGADAVVVHAGEVVAAPEDEARLVALCRAGGFGSDEYLAVQGRVRAAREQAGRPATDRLYLSLRELVLHAEATGVRLGLETRQEFNALPLLEEAEAMLSVFPSPMLGYWHDTGHAQRLQALGWCSAWEWLARLGGRLVGMHLHDCRGLRDHLIPSRGDVDFAAVLPYLRTDTVPSCEFDFYEEVSDIREGLDYLRRMGFERGGNADAK